VAPKPSWTGLVGIGTDGYRHILGVTEGDQEDHAGWLNFVRQLKDSN
jgi:transposase-like protein